MIVVGYTGSADATGALEISARLSIKIPSPLRIVHAFDLPTMDVPIGPGIDPPSQEEVERWCAEVTNQAEARARQIGATDVTSMVAFGPATGALIEQATEHDLIVVGHRGHGEVASAILGSVARQVTAHAPCPVLVVTKEATTELTGPIVVGVDGSAPSRKAADFAAEWANHFGRELVMVSAWQHQSMIGMAGGWALPMMSDASDQIEEATEAMLAELASELRTHYPELPIATRTVSGDAAHVLLAEAADATALVVGSRGRGGFTGLLLGSVSHRVLHHAGMPIAVVR